MTRFELLLGYRFPILGEIFGIIVLTVQRILNYVFLVIESVAVQNDCPKCLIVITFRAAYGNFTVVSTGQSGIEFKGYKFAVFAFYHRCHDVALAELRPFKRSDLVMRSYIFVKTDGF